MILDLRLVGGHPPHRRAKTDPWPRGNMSSSKATRASRRILVLALVGMPLGSFETYKPVPFAGSAPWGIAADPDGSMRFTEF